MQIELTHISKYVDNTSVDLVMIILDKYIHLNINKLNNANTEELPRVLFVLKQLNNLKDEMFKLMIKIANKVDLDCLDVEDMFVEELINILRYEIIYISKNLTKAPNFLGAGNDISNINIQNRDENGVVVSLNINHTNLLKCIYKQLYAYNSKQHSGSIAV